MQSDLEATPDSTVEELRMVCSNHHYYMARERVDLKEQRADYSFDLAGLMLVAALLSYNVELVEKQHGTTGADVVE